MLNLIDSLPAHSRYIAAIGDDEEAAEHMDPDAKPRPPRLTDWDPTVRALASIHDLLGELIRVQLAAGTGRKPPPMARYPRPVLASARVRERHRWAKHHALVARVLPNR